MQGNDKQQKFRPSISAHSIGVIMQLCQENISRDGVLEVLQALMPFHAKIQCKAIMPAYVAGAKIMHSNSLDSISNDSGFDALLDDSKDAEIFTAWRAVDSSEDFEGLFLALAYGIKRNLLTDEERKIASNYGLC